MKMSTLEIGMKNSGIKPELTVSRGAVKWNREKGTSDVACDVCVVLIAGADMLFAQGYNKVQLPTQKATPRGVLLPIITNCLVASLITYAMPLVVNDFLEGFRRYLGVRQFYYITQG